MFECTFNKYTFWLGFIIGGIVITSIIELLQIAMGTRKLAKELKRKNEIQERKEPKL